MERQRRKRRVHSKSISRNEISIVPERKASESGDTPWSKLSLRELLREYRRHLAPGAYFFLGQYENERLLDVYEIYVPVSQPTGISMQNVIYAFFEKGYPPPDLAKKGYEHWRHHYPFSHHEASTGSDFQDKLAVYLRKQLIRISQERLEPPNEAVSGR